VTRVGAQCQVEEVRDDEGQAPVGHGPQCRWAPPAAPEQFGQVGETYFARGKAGSGRGLVQEVRVLKRVVLETRSFGEQDQGLDGADGAGELAQELLCFVDTRPVPELRRSCLRSLERLVGDLGELGGRGWNVDLGDARHDARDGARSARSQGRLVWRGLLAATGTVSARRQRVGEYKLTILRAWSWSGACASWSRPGRPRATSARA